MKDATTFTSGCNKLHGSGHSLHTDILDRSVASSTSVSENLQLNSAQVPDLVPSSTHSGNDMYSEGAASIFLATFVWIRFCER